MIPDMTLKQLRMLREVARQAHNLSYAAAALHTSQPGVSRQIQLLERELGIELLARRRNRIVGFTAPGRAVLAAAERALSETDNIRLIAAEYTRDEGGQLSIATSHLHARYTLLAPVRLFAQRHPGVRLHLRQADPDDILKLVAAGEADIGISTEVGAAHPDLVFLRGRDVQRSLIMPPGHPLAATTRPTLKEIAQFPLVGYTRSQRGGQIIADTFRSAGLEPKLVVSAIDADIIKAYVAQGLGIAIIPALALEAETDRALRVTDVTHLFPRSAMTVSLRRDIFLRRFVPDFIQLVAPRWDRESIVQAMRIEKPAAMPRPRSRGRRVSGKSTRKDSQ